MRNAAVACQSEDILNRQDTHFDFLIVIPGDWHRGTGLLDQEEMTPVALYRRVGLHLTQNSRRRAYVSSFLLQLPDPGDGRFLALFDDASGYLERKRI